MSRLEVLGCVASRIWRSLGLRLRVLWFADSRRVGLKLRILRLFGVHRVYISLGVRTCRGLV